MSKPYVGYGSGSLPNVHWRAVDLDELRAMPRYRALPPVSSIELGSPCSFRYLRQDHPAWAAAHQGVLTTGSLKEALGLSEPDTLQRMGMPRSHGTKGAVQQVFFSLLQPAPHTKAVPRQQAARCRATNAASVDAYNAGMAAAPQPAKHVPADAVTRSQRNYAMLLGNRGLGAVRCAWGKAQEASSLSVLLHLLPDCILHEVGLCLVDPADLQQRYGFSVGHLPPLGASPDGLLQRPATNSQPSKASASSAPSSRSKGTDPRAELLDLLQQMDHMDMQSSMQDVAADSSSFAEAELEVVEVKNTCPFGYRSKCSSAIAVVDQGPRDRVLPLWVPQLQMEMLAAGTQRALLVTRSATKGVTVFRMERDEGYIKAMLDVLAYLHKTYVLPRRAPGGQPYKEYAQYTAFLQHTKRVAKSAVVVLHDAHAHRFAPERNMRLMLDDAPCIDD